MSISTPHGRGRRARKAVLAAISATVASAGSFTSAQVTLNKISNTDWTMTNGAGLTAVFNPQSENINSITFNGSANLLYPGNGTLDQEFAGTPFKASPNPVMNSVIGPNNSYVDVWTTENSGTSGTVTNPITYSFHYVLFAGDPSIHAYEVLNHASTDPATSVGQGQFLFRSNPSTFPNLYQVSTGPNNLAAVTTTPVPSTDPNFSTVTGEHTGSGTSAVFYRTVQNVTYDLNGSGIAGDNGTNFFTKYDYSIYTQFYQAETMYGSQYAVSEVDPSIDSLTGGPTRQELAWTDPGILNMEFLSDHYGIDGPGNGAYPGYAYYPTQGQNTTRVFGPFAFRIASTATESAAQINQDAVNSIANDQALYATDTALTSSGYVPNTSRGSVQVNASCSAGWSANTNNNTVVLSQPGVNMQESTQGSQYWAQISQNGAATVNNVVPGTYRMTLYQLGQWGETRVDGVQVQNGQVTIPQSVKFTPENFGTAAAIWTIGTPNRSSNEFMNGHNASGADQRQYYGAYDFWAEEQALGTPGYVSYNATATTIGGVPQAATNDPNKWIANQWYTFNPGLYDSSNLTTDNYQNTAPSYVRDSAHGAGTGPGPANYHGSAWQVHFTTTLAQQNQGQYVVVSVGLVAFDASLVLTLNGHSETWSYNNFKPDDPMVRSGDAGFYQWAAFEFPTTDLSAAGIANDNLLTFGVSSHTDGVMYDAIRMEITNTSANPAVTGWDDYTYINSGGSVAPNDAAGIQTLAWNNTGGTGDGSTWDNGTNQNWNTGVAESTFSSGANVVFGDNNNGHYNVTLNSSVSPLSMAVTNSAGNYVITGAGSITGSTSLAKYGTGSLTLDTVNTYTGGTSVNAGALIVGVAGALPNGPVTVTGGTLQLGTSTGLAQITSLSITGNGTFDVDNNHVIINYGSGPDPIASIAALLATGYNGGQWNGAGGIVTSAPLVVGGLSYGLGYADSADSGNPAGLSSGTIEIKYTLLGDADLNGIVNGLDFGILAANFNKGVTGWDQGDFDYNNIVNGIDFGDLAANFNKGVSGASVGAPAWADPALVAFAVANGLTADLPEPVAGSALTAGLMAALLPRRRRTCRYFAKIGRENAMKLISWPSAPAVRSERI